MPTDPAALADQLEWYIGDMTQEMYKILAALRRAARVEKAAREWLGHLTSGGDGTDITFDDEPAMLERLRAALEEEAPCSE